MCRRILTTIFTLALSLLGPAQADSHLPHLPTELTGIAAYPVDVGWRHIASAVGYMLFYPRGLPAALPDYAYALSEVQSATCMSEALNDVGDSSLGHIVMARVDVDPYLGFALTEPGTTIEPNAPDSAAHRLVVNEIPDDFTPELVERVSRAPDPLPDLNLSDLCDWLNEDFVASLRSVDGHGEEMQWVLITDLPIPSEDLEFHGRVDTWMTRNWWTTESFVRRTPTNVQSD